MKQSLLLIAGSLLVLSSCTQAPVQPTQSGANSSGNQAEVKHDTVSTTGSLVTLNYTLHKDSETGPVEETTVESAAKAAGLYHTGTTYSPYQTILGQGKNIFGFEKGLMGVKKGDKKIIKVTPDEGYGRAVKLPKEQIASEFTIVRPRSVFGATVKETIQKVQFPPQMADQVKNAAVGGEIVGVDGTKAKVVALDENTITLEFQNKDNPFAGKELKVGATASIAASDKTKGADFKVTKVDGDNITLDVVNKDSPFYGKKFAVGESASPEDGRKITIKEIGEQTVDIVVDHPLMNTTLFFDVEILDVQ